MGTFEKDLTAKSMLNVTDFVRIVGADSVTYKQLVSDVAKCIIETYSGSSLNGSSQSVKNAIDGIGEIAGDGTLDTTADTLTGAINEHETDIGTLVSAIGSTTMGTTADTLTGAINEHETDIGTLVSAIGSTTMGTTADTLTGAIAEHEGDLADLNSKLTKSYTNISQYCTRENTAPSDMTINLQLRKVSNMVHLRGIITSATGFTAGESLGKLFTIDTERAGFKLPTNLFIAGIAHTNASYPEFSTGDSSSWTIFQYDGSVYARTKLSGCKSMAFCTTFVEGW